MSRSGDDSVDVEVEVPPGGVKGQIAVVFAEIMGRVGNRTWPQLVKLAERDYPLQTKLPSGVVRTAQKKWVMYWEGEPVARQTVINAATMARKRVRWPS